MKRISIPEFGRIPRSELGKKLLVRLQAFDERHGRVTGGCVFDWDRLHYIRATNYVGVVQVPGLVVEILPKIDTSRRADDAAFVPGETRQVRAQRNLLYMLSFTKKIPVRERELAALHVQDMPLFEALVRIFVERLLTELGRGLDRTYVHRQQNERFLKGKLLVGQHIRINAAHRERFFVGYDEFVADTWLNRALKAACHRLLGLTASDRTQQRLRESLLHLAGAADVVIRSHHFEQIHLNRNTERFRTLVDFARIVLTEAAPAPAMGKMRTFSLLFPMEKLFEEFVARFMRRYCEALGLTPDRVHVQAARRRRWLLRAAAGGGRFRLKPDVIIDRPGGGAGLILDTKWKRLLTDREDVKNGVAQGDLYQLYAYAHRYDSPDNVLLFPMIKGVTAKSYRLEGEEDKRVRIEFLDLNRDLRRQRAALVEDLRRIIGSDQEVAADRGQAGVL